MRFALAARIELVVAVGFPGTTIEVVPPSPQEAEKTRLRSRVFVHRKEEASTL